jgi:CRP/FNR family cyclic AMP-dependent transcriptional regulator
MDHLAVAADTVVPAPAAPPGLGALSPALRALVDGAPRQRFPRDRLLMREGDGGGTLFVVLEGELRVFSADPESGREFTFSLIGPGDYVGEMALDGGPRSASVIASTSTLCALVDRPRLRAHIAADPDFAFELLSRVILRARLASRSARDVALLDAYRRLVALFAELSVPDGEDRLIPGPLSQATIAQRIGCSREMVTRLVASLDQGGYLQRLPGRAWRVKARLPARW